MSTHHEYKSQSHQVGTVTDDGGGGGGGQSVFKEPHPLAPSHPLTIINDDTSHLLLDNEPFVSIFFLFFISLSLFF